MGDVDERKIVVATHFPADISSPQGGVEAVSVNLVKGLAQLKGLDLHVVTLDQGVSRDVRKRWENVTLHRLSVKPGSFLLNVCGAWRNKLQQYISNLRPDLVHAHDTYGIMVQGMTLPRVFTIHGFIYSDAALSDKKFSWIRSKIWRFIETRSWADQPNIISISPYVRERLKGIARGRIYDIDNPVDGKFFAVKRSELAGTVFCAALISPRKNTLALVEAFGKIAYFYPNASLRLAGAIANADYGRAVQERIQALGLDGRVFLLGRLSVRQVRDELAKASIFSLVSLEENSPMGIEEAMAAGVPVVTSN